MTRLRLELSVEGAQLAVVQVVFLFGLLERRRPSPLLLIGIVFFYQIGVFLLVELLLDNNLTSHQTFRKSMLELSVCCQRSGSVRARSPVRLNAAHALLATISISMQNVLH